MFDIKRDNPNTLINKFYGMYSFDTNNENKTTYFIIMESLFYSNLNVDEIYDLKGSKKGRLASDKDKQRKIVVFKDLDWIKANNRIHIGSKLALLYKRQLYGDLEFLNGHQIMDYSLLVGIANTSEPPNTSLLFANLNQPYLFKSHYNGIGLSNKIYFTGIIDILQKYNSRKKVENKLRRIMDSQQKISCAPPTVYSDRMYDFLIEYIF